MATVSNHQVLRKEKRVTPFSELAQQPEVRADILLKISNLLQSTLDYRDQLGVFFRELNHVVLIDGLSYHNDNQNIHFDIGHPGKHSCTYRLTTRQSYLGELIFTRNTRFREHELANIEAIIGTLVYPLRNGLEYQQAVQAALIDPLTGAANRVALDKNLSREIELSKRYGRNFSLLMTDLDYFKKINDNHGHGIGDQVLKEVVKTIMSCIRQTDMCFRYGGEEFIVALSNANILDAEIIAERIRQSIPKLDFQGEKGPFNVTVSIGACQLKATESLDQMIDRADAALYEAKRNGRDCVKISED